VNAPLCPLCKARDCSYTNEPGKEGYYSTCYVCSLLTGYRDHSHVEHPSEAQVRAGTYPAGHSWRTVQILRPLWENGRHVGYRCAGHNPCGFEEWFTNEAMEPCPVHSGDPRYGEVLRGVCLNWREHRFERGECDEKGYITEFGRREEKRRSDKANWDPES